MIDMILSWGPVVVVLASMGLLALWTWFHFPDLNADEVVDFLQHIDLDKAQILLDPGVEFSLRIGMSPQEFRSLQRKRIHLYVEILKRMAHNSAVLVDLGNREVERCERIELLHSMASNAPLGELPPMIARQTAEAAKNVQEEAIRVRIYSLATLLRLRFWIFIRLHSWSRLPSLSLCDARETCGIAGLQTYGRLKTAAGDLFLQLRSHRFDELAQSL
jgi:hypothetical protein